MSEELARCINPQLGGTTMVWPYQKNVRGKNTKINYGMDTGGEKKKRTSKINVDGRSTSSHDK
jgi:hypothetical protein